MLSVLPSGYLLCNAGDLFSNENYVLRFPIGPFRVLVELNISEENLPLVNTAS